MIKNKFILFTIISLVVNDAINYISWTADSTMGSATYITALLNYISLFIILSIAFKSKWNDEIPKLIKNLYKLWIFWSVVNLIRGAFLASDYWDWKLLFLSATFFTLVSLAFILGRDLDIVQIIFKFVFKYLFPFGFLLIPLALVTNEELYSRIMIPISLFLLFLPFVKFKWKLLLLIVMVTSVLLVLEFRSNIAKIAFSLILLLAYSLRTHIRQSWLQLTHFLLFAIPVVLFILGVTNNYNIFEETGQEAGNSTSISQHGEDDNLLTDSRTFLYVEVLGSLDRSNDWLIGRSSIGSYMSDFFYDEGGAMKGKRYGCEVGILNILLQYGIVGVLCYFLLLFVVSRYAIKYSNNFLAKMIGLFIAFRWTYSFVEEYTQYDLNFYFFWIAIGLVSSSKFRNMTDNEIRNYFELL
jgi:hypothetical protein